MQNTAELLDSKEFLRMSTDMHSQKRYIAKSIFAHQKIIGMINLPAFCTSDTSCHVRTGHYECTDYMCIQKISIRSQGALYSSQDNFQQSLQ